MYNYLILLIMLIFSLTIVSCHRSEEGGKLNFYSNNLGKKSFSFTAKEQFLRNHHISKADMDYNQISKTEFNLLSKLLKTNHYCINEKGKLSFILTSKQPEIYDLTFADLIAKNYNIKPIVPLTYFGECT